MGGGWGRQLNLGAEVLEHEKVACDCLGLLVNASQYVNADISEGIWVQGEPFLAGSSEETCDFSPLTALFLSSFPLCSLAIGAIVIHFCLPLVAVIWSLSSLFTFWEQRCR